MSAVTDAAQLEAAIAENDLNEAEAETLRLLVTESGTPLEDAVRELLESRDGTGQTLTLAAAEGPLGEPTEKQLRDLERAVQRHLERVRTIMGGHVAGFEECDKCGGYGLTPPGPQPQTHEWFVACPTCEGFGQVLTGSLREGQQSRDCPQCKGRGYLEALGANGAPLADGGTPAGAAPPAAPQLEPPAAPPADGANGAGLQYGTPSWMGDASIGR